MSIITHSMPYEDDVFDPDEELEALLRPDEDEISLMRAANKRVKKKTQRREDRERLLKTLSALESGGGFVSGARNMGPTVAKMEEARIRQYAQGSRNENMGPIVAEREREFLQDIFNPLHNARQIAKELTLLEDHLIQPPQHCPDCIRKHLLRAEAYADEASGLDEEGEHAELFGDVSQAIRGVARSYLQDGSQPEERHAMAQRVRKIRKHMSKMGFHTVLGSRMRGDAPPQPRLSEVVDRDEVVYGSENVYGVKRKRSRKRVKAFRGDGYGAAPPGDPLSKTVGTGAVTLSTGLTSPRNDVYLLQGFLRANEIGDVRNDGIYDSKTERAVTFLQRAAALPEDGKFDRRLFDAFIGYGLVGNTSRSRVEATRWASLISKTYQAQQNLVEAGALTQAQFNKEAGNLGGFTETAIKNFLTSIEKPTTFSSLTSEALKAPDDTTLALLLDPSNVERAKNNPSKMFSATDLPIKGVQEYLVGANLLWPGEDSGTLDNKTVAAIKDFQRAAQGIAASKGLSLSPTGVLDADTNKALIDGEVLRAVTSMVRFNPNGIGDGSGKVVPWSKTARKAPEVQRRTASPKTAPAAKTTASTPRRAPAPAAPAVAPAAPAAAPATAPAAAAVAAPVAAAATAAAVAQPAQASVARRRGLFERPAPGEPTDVLTEAIPYVAAGAGIMLLAGLLMGRDR